jgi:mono/diheme cytochrome c family protein
MEAANRVETPSSGCDKLGRGRTTATGELPLPPARILTNGGGMLERVAPALGIVVALSPLTLGAQELASPASMVSPFEGVCASCHDNTSDEERAPSREALRQMTPERVLAALTTGPMTAFAENMSDAERRAMAELASGKPFGGTANRTAAAMANRCTEPLALRDPFQRPRWNGWNPDPTNGYRFQPRESGGVTAADLGRLKLKWAFAIPDAASASQTQPTIVGGALFIGSDNNFVYALDARSGCVHWSFEAQRPKGRCARRSRSARSPGSPARATPRTSATTWATSRP